MSYEFIFFTFGSIHDMELGRVVSSHSTPNCIWESPVLRYHKIMVIYPYSFFVVISQLFSWIIFIDDCICILTDLPE